VVVSSIYFLEKVSILLFNPEKRQKSELGQVTGRKKCVNWRWRAQDICHWRYWITENSDYQKCTT